MPGEQGPGSRIKPASPGWWPLLPPIPLKVELKLLNMMLSRKNLNRHYFLQNKSIFAKNVISLLTKTAVTCMKIILFSLIRQLKSMLISYSSLRTSYFHYILKNNSSNERSTYNQWPYIFILIWQLIVLIDDEFIIKRAWMPFDITLKIIS